MAFQFRVNKRLSWQKPPGISVSSQLTKPRLASSLLRGSFEYNSFMSDDDLNLKYRQRNPYSSSDSIAHRLNKELGNCLNKIQQPIRCSVCLLLWYTQLDCRGLKEGCAIDLLFRRLDRIPLRYVDETSGSGGRGARRARGSGSAAERTIPSGIIDVTSPGATAESGIP